MQECEGRSVGGKEKGKGKQILGVRLCLGIPWQGSVHVLGKGEVLSGTIYCLLVASGC